MKVVCRQGSFVLGTKRLKSIGWEGVVVSVGETGVISPTWVVGI